MAKNTTDLHSIDWSKYSPERVEELKLIFRQPSSEEDGEPTEDELKALCFKWEWRVDMTINNFVYWTLRKTKISRYNRDEERFKKSMPKLLGIIQRRGCELLGRYLIKNAEMHKRHLERCAELRRNELRRIRYFDKLRAFYSARTTSECSDNSIGTNSTDAVDVNRFNCYVESESDDDCRITFDEV